MSDVYTIETRGFTAMSRFVGALPGAVTVAAVRAVNRGADRTRTEAARSISEALNFGPGYLKPANGKLYVASYAQDNSNPSAVIRAKDRPTSLARFVTSGQVGRKGGVSVMVKRGHTKFLPNAFLIRLRQGAAMDDENFNLGLAVRLKPGETIKNKRAAMQMKNGLWLLYGPSVGQAFGALIKNNGLSERAGDFAEIEFDRALEFLKL